MGGLSSINPSSHHPLGIGDWYPPLSPFYENNKSHYSQHQDYQEQKL